MPHWNVLATVRNDGLRQAMELLEETGEPGHIAFDGAEAIIMVETVGTQAGLSLWSREELARYPFLHPD